MGETGAADNEAKVTVVVGCLYTLYVLYLRTTTFGFRRSLRGSYHVPTNTYILGPERDNALPPPHGRQTVLHAVCEIITPSMCSTPAPVLRPASYLKPSAQRIQHPPQARIAKLSQVPQRI